MKDNTKRAAKRVVELSENDHQTPASIKTKVKKDELTNNEENAKIMKPENKGEELLVGPTDVDKAVKICLPSPRSDHKDEHTAEQDKEIDDLQHDDGVSSRTRTTESNISSNAVAGNEGENINLQLSNLDIECELKESVTNSEKVDGVPNPESQCVNVPLTQEKSVQCFLPEQLVECADNHDFLLKLAESRKKQYEAEQKIKNIIRSDFEKQDEYYTNLLLLLAESRHKENEAEEKLRSKRLKCEDKAVECNITEPSLDQVFFNEINSEMHKMDSRQLINFKQLTYKHLIDVFGNQNNSPNNGQEEHEPLNNGPENGHEVQIEGRGVRRIIIENRNPVDTNCRQSSNENSTAVRNTAPASSGANNFVPATFTMSWSVSPSFFANIAGCVKKLNDIVKSYNENTFRSPPTNVEPLPSTVSENSITTTQSLLRTANTSLNSNVVSSTGTNSQPVATTARSYTTSSSLVLANSSICGSGNATITSPSTNSSSLSLLPSAAVRPMLPPQAMQPIRRASANSQWMRLRTPNELQQRRQSLDIITTTIHGTPMTETLTMSRGSDSPTISNRQYRGPYLANPRNTITTINSTVSSTSSASIVNPVIIPGRSLLRPLNDASLNGIAGDLQNNTEPTHFN